MPSRTGKLPLFGFAETIIEFLGVNTVFSYLAQYNRSLLTESRCVRLLIMVRRRTEIGPEILAPANPSELARLEQEGFEWTALGLVALPSRLLPPTEQTTVDGELARPPIRARALGPPFPSYQPSG